MHRSEGEPGWSAGEGGTQRIRVLIEDMVVEGELGELPAYIYEGSLTVGGSTQDNMVPFPSAYTDIVRLSMMLSENARVVIVSGSGGSIQPEGEFTFVEHSLCRNSDQRYWMVIRASCSEGYAATWSGS